MQINSYRDLIVWQKSMGLVTSIYELTNVFPLLEQYGLTNQIRRSAISVPSNIAEGYGRNSTNDYKRFLQIANGSLFELQTQVEISYNLKYIPLAVFDDITARINEIEKMLISLIKKIN